MSKHETDVEARRTFTQIDCGEALGDEFLSATPSYAGSSFCDTKCVFIYSDG